MGFQFGANEPTHGQLLASNYISFWQDPRMAIIRGPRLDLVAQSTSPAICYTLYAYMQGEIDQLGKIKEALWCLLFGGVSCQRAVGLINK